MTENVRTLNNRFYDLLLAVRSDGLIVSSAVLFSFSMVGNLANYFFQFFMSRHLTPSDYGTLNALLSLLVIISIPGGAITLVVAHYVSRYKAREEYGKISSFFSGSLRRVTLLGIVLFVLFALFSKMISDFLRIPSVSLVLIVSLILVTSLCLTVNFGMLQGLQKFSAFGITGSLAGVLRLVFGILLIYVGFSVAGALWAGVLANLVIIIMTFFLLRYLFEYGQDAPVKDRSQEVVYYGFPVAISLFCYTTLTNLDVVLVKHYFDAPTAGQYAAASILAKIILYLPGAIVLALFPKISELHVLEKDSKNLLLKAMGLTAVLSGFTVGLYVFYPSVVVLLFGQKFSEAVSLIGLFGLTMFPFALVNIVINFYLARRDSGFIYLLAGSTILQMVLIMFFHQSLQQILTIMLINGAGLLLLSLLWMRGQKASFARDPL
jgi:O-antigen/teichoic acid export membrane protein